MPTDKPLFAFTVSTLPADTFHVVRFSGEEGLSTLYRFEITLISQNMAVDFDAALQGKARLSIACAEGPERLWHGVLSDFRQTQRVGGHSFYTAVLVPRAYRLLQTRDSRIFLNQDIPATLAECLKAAGFSQDEDFEVVTSRSYARRDYVCQYNETPYHFLSRWMERNGLYFFFDQSQGRDRLVVTETLTAHPPLPGTERLVHTEPSGLEAPLTGTAVQGFRGHKRRLPKEVLLRDYNYRTPNLEITAKAQVCKNGEGTVYVHGGGIRTLTEAKLLAHARAQEIACRGLVFSGESNAPQMAPGYLFTLSNHFRDDFNQRYLATLARHEGNQESWLTAGIATRGLGEGLFYRNAFTAIPADVQYRAECKTDWPAIVGTMSAFIDAEGGGDTPELDQHGRYKVIMPFDVSGRAGGKATAWIRMAQPYAGEGCGMHFPLRKGTEVLVGFMHGNPDMPVIQAAVPNPVTPSPVTGDNQTQARITTAGGNLIHMDDRDGGQSLHLQSPHSSSFFRLGAPAQAGGGAQASDKGNSGGAGGPQDALKPQTLYTLPNGSTGIDQNQFDIPDNARAWTQMSGPNTAGITMCTGGTFTVDARFANTVILGENAQLNVGAYSCSTLGENFTLNAGLVQTINTLVYHEFSTSSRTAKIESSEASVRRTEMDNNLKQMCTDNTKLIGKHTKLIGELDESIEELFVAATSKTAIIAKKLETCATKDELTETRQSIESQCTTIRQNATDLNARVSAINGTVETMADNVTQCMNSRVVLMNGNQEVTDRHLQIATTDQRVVGAMTIV